MNHNQAVRKVLMKESLRLRGLNRFERITSDRQKKAERLREKSLLYAMSPGAISQTKKTSKIHKIKHRPTGKMTDPFIGGLCNPR